MDTKHPLAAWLDEHPDVTQSSFAKDAECSEPHLSLILQRKRGVSMKLAQRFNRATGGAVPIEAFLLEPEAAAQ